MKYLIEINEEVITQYGCIVLLPDPEEIQPNVHSPGFKWDTKKCNDENPFAIRVTKVKD